MFFILHILIAFPHMSGRNVINRDGQQAKHQFDVGVDSEIIWTLINCNSSINANI